MNAFFARFWILEFWANFCDKQKVMMRYWRQTNLKLSVCLVLKIQTVKVDKVAVGGFGYLKWWTFKISRFQDLQDFQNTGILKLWRSWRTSKCWNLKTLKPWRYWTLESPRILNSWKSKDLEILKVRRSWNLQSPKILKSSKSEDLEILKPCVFSRVSRLSTTRFSRWVLQNCQNLRI